MISKIFWDQTQTQAHNNESVSDQKSIAYYQPWTKSLILSISLVN